MKNHLRALRTGRRWTQAEVAEKLGISRQSVHSIESGKSEPSLALAYRFADLFDLPVEEIFENPSRRKRTK